MVKNQSHTLAYSLIGLQEMNLAYRFPIMFWNCACLISDAGGDETDSGGDEEIEVGGTDSGSTYEMAEGFVDFGNEESDDDDDAGEDNEEDADTASTAGTAKPKKRTRTTNYGRIL